MPRFEPFAGLRYDVGALSARGATLDDVVAPPYDVIDPAQREALAARSPWNAVRVELPADDPETGQDRYAAAAALLAGWRDAGVLGQDPGPAFYAYRMGFTDAAGRHRRTCGVIGALEVSAPGQGDVLPHEHTMPKPKSDRLDLLRACRANLSPVWGLSLASGLSALVEASAPGEPRAGAGGSATGAGGGGADAGGRRGGGGQDGAGGLARAQDEDGVEHQLWALTDPDQVAAITAMVGSAPVVIADGHHRYETSIVYRQERREANGGAAGDYDLVMALIVELADDQLAVGPIHRLVEGLPAGFDLPAAVAPYFELERGRLSLGAGDNGRGRVAGSGVGGDRAGAGPAGRDQAGAGPASAGPAGGPTLLTAEGTWYLRARPETVARAGEDLDSSRLSLALEGLPAHELTYHHDAAEVVAAVAGGRASAGILVRPAPVAVIAAAARDRRRMPPKSTFFWPKPRTGMVLRPVVG